MSVTSINLTSEMDLSDPYKIAEIESFWTRGIFFSFEGQCAKKIQCVKFVGNNNQKLHSILERGLQIAVADGSFDKLLYNHQITKQIFEQANIDKRIIFDLQNPLLSLATQKILNDTSLWYQVGDEHRQ